MDRRFLLLTGLCSTGMFVGTWAALGASSPGHAVASPSATPPVYFARCAEAWDAGVAPIYRGQPGYRPGLDGDDDGIACEPYPGRSSYPPRVTGGRFRL